MNVSRHSQEAVIVSQLGVNGVSESGLLRLCVARSECFPYGGKSGRKTC